MNIYPCQLIHFQLCLSLDDLSCFLYLNTVCNIRVIIKWLCLYIFALPALSTKSLLHN